MSVNILIGTRLQGGLGKVLWNDAMGVDRTGKLNMMYCYDADLPESIGAPHVVLTEMNAPNYMVKDALTDYDLAFRLTPCDAFHTLVSWSPLSNEIMKNRYGTKIVFQAPSCQVVEHHEVEYERAKFDLPKKGDMIFKTGYEHRAYDTVDYVVTPSNMTKQQIVDVYNIEENRIKVIRPGVEMPEEPGETSRRFNILSVGTVGLRKGQIYTSEACKDMDIEVNLVGRKTLADRTFASNCNVPGYVDNIDEYYENASIYCQASVSDGFPNSVLRAMSYGKPVIVTEGVGCKEIIEDGKHGFVVPRRDAKAIRDKVQYFRDNPSEVRRMGRNARNLVEEYTWNRYRNEIAEFYNTEVLK